MTPKDKRNLMIVEDDSGIAETLVMTLQLMNYNVFEVVSNAEDAIPKAKETRPDLIIMDIFLAGSMDGITAGKLIEQTLGIPVLYITGYREKAAFLEGQGVIPLLKPFDPNDLRAAIGVIFYRADLQNKIHRRHFPQK